jgi:hypothetical protein
VRYEWRRLAIISVAALAVYALAVFGVRDEWPAIVRLVARGGVVSVAFPALLIAGGVFGLEDLRALVALRDGLRQPDRMSAGEEVELGGEIAATPSIVDRAGMKGTAAMDDDARPR